MALSRSRVGDSVVVEPRRGVRLHGVILSIDAQGLRCVATEHGFSYHVPAELDASDVEVPAKRADELAPGDVVILFNGLRRTVAEAVTTGSPPRCRVTFAADDFDRGAFHEQVVEPSALYRLAGP